MNELAISPAPYRKAPRLGFGDYVRAARRDLRMTQPKFAALLGIKRETLAAWESGRNNPDDVPEMAELIEACTGFSRAFFLGWGDTPAPKPGARIRTDWTNRSPLHALPSSRLTVLSDRIRHGELENDQAA